jgi:phage FluMu protein Com
MGQTSEVETRELRCQGSLDKGEPCERLLVKIKGNAVVVVCHRCKTVNSYILSEQPIPAAPAAR